MARAEQKRLGYLFKLRLTARVKKLLKRLMRGAEWTDAGQGWQGVDSELRLSGWSRQRCVWCCAGPWPNSWPCSMRPTHSSCD
jgi:hypothetical protein